jgi:hypothetical protein
LGRAQISHLLEPPPLMSFKPLISTHSLTHLANLRGKREMNPRSTLPSKQKFNPHLE